MPRARRSFSPAALLPPVLQHNGLGILVLWLVIAFTALAARGPQAGTNGLILMVFGILMIASGRGVPVPRAWWLLAAGFLLTAAGPFLPAAWFPAVSWRSGLEGAGLATGDRIVIQVRHAAEAYALYGFTLLAALWLATRRVTAPQLRLFATLFVTGVALFAALAFLARDPGIHDHFGFFPNRNHTGTYLAMGAMCGLGAGLQALRDKAYVRMSVALAATAICLWALLQWSISRGGILLIAVCGICWLPMLGRRYLGTNGLRVVALLGLLIVGAFFVTESRVKERIFETAERAGSTADGESGGHADIAALDLRIPIALDTFDLIRDFPLTGIGARQFPYVFPQYRTRTAYVNEMRLIHPESDWLWIASEAGLPAVIILGALAILAFWKSLRGCFSGHDRALRSACLLAAAMVPLHGVFDVPGHRIELALAAAFLWMLSLRPREESSASAERPVSPFLVFSYRLIGGGVLAAGVALLSSFHSGRPEFRQARSLADQSRALELYHKALPDGPNTQLIDAPTLIECANLLSAATRDVPMDGRLWQLHGRVLMFFPARYPEAARAMAIERLLNPPRISIPLEQAAEWIGTDAGKTAELWSEGLARADALDRKNPLGRWREGVERSILRTAGPDPGLAAVAKSLLRKE